MVTEGSLTWIWQNMDFWPEVLPKTHIAWIARRSHIPIADHMWELISWEVDFMRIDFARIDLVGVDLVISWHRIAHTVYGISQLLMLVYQALTGRIESGPGSKFMHLSMSSSTYHTPGVRGDWAGISSHTSGQTSQILVEYCVMQAIRVAYFKAVPWAIIDHPLGTLIQC